MFKSLITVLKALSNPSTIKYPAGTELDRYSHLPENLRGKPNFYIDKCTGCLACVSQCSSGALTGVDVENSRKLTINLNKCVFCRRCAEICPEDALELTNKFELASNVKSDLTVSNDVELVKCINCYTYFVSGRQLERIVERLKENLKETKAIEYLHEDLQKYLYLCQNCRKTLSLKLNIHTRKHVLFE
ncbi:MAG: 4Fe-4S binding protein [Candidatus Methanomethylicia archaeon]|nr:4Fe-4S binding protein [Candidatus Methanomethylicia archaeon]